MRNGLTVLGTTLLLVAAATAQATPVTIDQIIYQGSTAGTTVDNSLLSGTLDVTVSGAQQLTILMTNTSADGAFTGTGNVALMLLTGFGIELPGLNVTGGTVTVNLGSTALNFDGGQSTTDISNQWLYSNGSIDGYSSIPGALAVDTVTSSISVTAPSATRFAGPPPTNIDGPDYGALSAFETEFGSSTAGVSDTIKFVLNLDGTAPDPSAIDAGNVVLAFGSPTLIPEPGTGLLLGMGLIGLAWYRRGR